MSFSKKNIVEHTHIETYLRKLISKRGFAFEKTLHTKVFSGFLVAFDKFDDRLPFFHKTAYVFRIIFFCYKIFESLPTAANLENPINWTHCECWWLQIFQKLVRHSYGVMLIFSNFEIDFWKIDFNRISVSQNQTLENLFCLIHPFLGFLNNFWQIFIL